MDPETLKSSNEKQLATKADQKNEHDKPSEYGNIMIPEKSQTKSNEKQLTTSDNQKDVSEHDVQPSEQFAKLKLQQSDINVDNTMLDRQDFGNSLSPSMLAEFEQLTNDKIKAAVVRGRSRRNSDAYERYLVCGRDYTDSEDD